MQPIVSDDVAAALADVAINAPVNGMIELAGPEPIRQDELVRRFLSANKDARKVATDVSCSLLRNRAERSEPHPGRQPAHRADAFRGLAQPLRSSKEVTRQGRRAAPSSAPNRKELPVTLPTVYHGVRLRIREAADCWSGLFGSASLSCPKGCKRKFMCALNDKVVIVTGGSSGIGRAAASSFAKQGAKTIVTARRDAS